MKPLCACDATDPAPERRKKKKSRKSSFRRLISVSRWCGICKFQSVWFSPSRAQETSRRTTLWRNIRQECRKHQKARTPKAFWRSRLFLATLMINLKNPVWILEIIFFRSNLLRHMILFRRRQKLEPWSFTHANHHLIESSFERVGHWSLKFHGERNRIMERVQRTRRECQLLI